MSIPLLPGPASSARKVGSIPTRLHPPSSSPGTQERTIPTKTEPRPILPPSKESFDGSTRMVAGPEIDAIVDRVLAYPEFKDLASLPGRVIWYQKRKFIDEQPVFAFVKKWDDDAVWDAENVRHIEGYQRWKLGLNWRNFDDLAGEGNYVTDETLERHIYLALMSVLVTEGKGIVKNHPSIATWHEAIVRYGAYDVELKRLQGVLVFPED